MHFYWWMLKAFPVANNNNTVGSGWMNGNPDGNMQWRLRVYFDGRMDGRLNRKYHQRQNHLSSCKNCSHYSIGNCKSMQILVLKLFMSKNLDFTRKQDYYNTYFLFPWKIKVRTLCNHPAAFGQHCLARAVIKAVYHWTSFEFSFLLAWHTPWWDQRNWFCPNLICMFI